MSEKDDAKPLCFVIMPFSPEFDEVYTVIREAGIGAGFHTERADENYTPEKVPDRIEALLRDAALLIAEISMTNPNVYYELGLAHANQKPVILVCREGTEPPFDIQHWSHITYTDTEDLRGKLLAALLPMRKQVRSAEPRERPSRDEDIEVGKLAVRCEIISDAALKARLAQLEEPEWEGRSLLELLRERGELTQSQTQILTQVQCYLSEYFESVSRSLTVPTWVRSLHRNVKFISWCNRAAGDPPRERRPIEVLGTEIDVYDEALYADTILFQKFEKGSFNARSTGTVLLHEMETEEYRCFIPPNSLSFYQAGGGHALQYAITRKEGASLPLLVQRSLTYLNGFQTEARADNRQAGIVASVPIERLMLTVDLESIPHEITEVRAELRHEDETRELEVNRASARCFYAQCTHPPLDSALYIVWRWKA